MKNTDVIGFKDILHFLMLKSMSMAYDVAGMNGSYFSTSEYMTGMGLAISGHAFTYLIDFQVPSPPIVFDVQAGQHLCIYMKRKQGIL